MTIQIDTGNRLLLSDEHGVLRDTGLGLAQRRDQTVVYTREDAGGYKEHPMPHVRYSTAHERPCKPDGTPTGAAGVGQLEADVRALLG